MNEVECRNCGAAFDLSAQWYYDNLRPSCKAEDADDDPTARMRNRGRRGDSERVGVCSLACKHALERRRKCS